MLARLTRGPGLCSSSKRWDILRVAVFLEVPWLRGAGDSKLKDQNQTQVWVAPLEKAQTCSEGRAWVSRNESVILPSGKQHEMRPSRWKIILKSVLQHRRDSTFATASSKSPSWSLAHSTRLRIMLYLPHRSVFRKCFVSNARTSCVAGE